MLAKSVITLINTIMNSLENIELVNNEKRVSPLEIDRAVLVLQNSFSDGHLNYTELDQRMTALMYVKTRGELSLIVDDLIDVPENKPNYQNKSIAFFSGIEHKGRFVLPEHYRIVALFGGCSIDLSKAHLSSLCSDIDISAIFGGVEIFVPEGVKVVVSGQPIFGGIANQVIGDNLAEHAPMIRIHAKCIFGGISITSSKKVKLR